MTWTFQELARWIIRHRTALMSTDSIKSYEAVIREMNKYSGITLSGRLEWNGMVKRNISRVRYNSACMCPCG